MTISTIVIKERELNVVWKQNVSTEFKEDFWKEILPATQFCYKNNNKNAVISGSSLNDKLKLNPKVVSLNPMWSVSCVFEQDTLP